MLYDVDDPLHIKHITKMEAADWISFGICMSWLIIIVVAAAMVAAANQ